MYSNKLFWSLITAKPSINIFVYVEKKNKKKKKKDEDGDDELDGD